MANLKELRDERMTIATNARSKFDEIKDDTKEDRASEIEREFDAMMVDHDKLGATIERLEKIEKIEAEERAAKEAVDKSKRPNVSGEGRGADLGDTPTYDQAWRAWVAAQGEVGAMAPEMRTVLQAGINPEKRAQTSSTTTEGGFTAPVFVSDFIIKTMAIWGPMYDGNITTEIVTSQGGAITIPTVDDTAKVVAKSSQGVTKTDDGGVDVVFGSKTLDAFEFDTEWLRISKALADDSAFDIGSFIGGLLGERLGRRANVELTTGDGTGDPNGVVTASSVGVTATGTSSITFDELIEHLHKVNAAYRVSPKTRWMMSDTTFGVVRKLKDGNGRYLWEDNQQVGMVGMLLGYPVTVNAAMAEMTTGLKPIIFGDFGKYYVRKVGGIEVVALQDKDFWPGFGMAGMMRLDGELGDTAAVKHLLMS